MSERGELAICERILDHVGGAADTTVTVHRTRGALTRFATSFIHQNVAEDAVSITVTLAVDGQVATAGTTDASDDGLTRLIDSTLAAARVSPRDPYYPGLASANDDDGENNAPEHYDEATADADPAARAAVVAAFVEAAAGLEAAGYCATTASSVALANSAGLRRTGRATSAELSGVARIEGAEGRGARVAASLADLDGTVSGRQAADVARAALDPIEVDPGEYEVVLERGCVASMLDFFTIYGFNGKASVEGQSFVHLGEEQFDPAISIWDDVADARAIGLGFDAEGTMRRRLALVDAGRSVGLAYDRRTAHRASAEPTGHAMGDASSGGIATNLFLAPGGADDLLAGVGRGLQVHGFWYLRPLDPKTQVVTGLTRNGLFLVEDGHITHGVKNLRFTQSFVSALAPGHVRAVGDRAELTTGDLSSIYGFAHHVPTLHLASWHFSGGAQG